MDNDQKKVDKSINSLNNCDKINKHVAVWMEYLNTSLPPGLPPHILENTFSSNFYLP